MPGSRNGGRGNGDILNFASDQPKTISRRVAGLLLAEFPILETYQVLVFSSMMKSIVSRMS